MVKTAKRTELSGRHPDLYTTHCFSQFHESTATQIARSVGFDIIRVGPRNSSSATLARMLAINDIDLVFGISANTGLNAASLRQAGNQKRIVSFESQLSAHKQLVEKCRKDLLWSAHACIGLGDGKHSATIHVAVISVSSSVLPMLETYVQAAP